MAGCLDKRFKSVIAYDPWIFPLYKHDKFKIHDDCKLLVVMTDGFPKE